MRVNPQFLSAYVNRFTTEITDDWLRSKLCSPAVLPCDFDAPDSAFLLRELQIALETVYVPYAESYHIARWIYQIARGYVAHRYQSAQEYIDVCMTPIVNFSAFSQTGRKVFAPERVPIYAIDGLPGVGKSSLVQALRRVFPAPTVLDAEGDPPQRVETLSALWIEVAPQFSLLSWVKNTLEQFGVDSTRHRNMNTLEQLTKLMFKTLYRVGVGVVIVDELQFASGKSSARRVTNQLMSMRGFGVPIVFFANTDFIRHIEDEPAQVAQRIPRERQTLYPMLRDDPMFSELIKAQLSLVPYGHSIDLHTSIRDLYYMVAGLPRASARLIELAATTSIQEKRKLTMLDLVTARASQSFKVFREQIALLSATAPVDEKKYAELSSNNVRFDAAAAYKRELNQLRLADAAAQALFETMSDQERERAQAVETQILRVAGKIPENIHAIGEAKRPRGPKASPDEVLKNSYAAQQAVKFTPRNPVLRPEDPDDVEKR